MRNLVLRPGYDLHRSGWIRADLVFRPAMPGAGREGDREATHQSVKRGYAFRLSSDRPAVTCNHDYVREIAGDGRDETSLTFRRRCEGLLRNSSKLPRILSLTDQSGTAKVERQRG